MRVLFCWPAAEFSVSDVARGYRSALARQGHDLVDYEFSKRVIYHARALGGGPDACPNRWAGSEDAYIRAISKQATETVVVEAIYHDAELVVIVSGLNFHPLSLQLLRYVGFRTAVLHTESPYEDEEQAAWSAAYPAMSVFTHERSSAARYGWGYLPHAYDPAIHYRRDPDPAAACDVLLVGTGWPERQQLLEQVDWTGIRLVLRGLWPTLTPESPLWPFYQEGCIDNTDLPRLYASAAIGLNLHRYHPDAVSLNPRAYELAACGAFQICDDRAEVRRLLPSVPTFRTAFELETLIRYYLESPDARRLCADDARRRVVDETFDARAAALMAALHEHQTAPDAAIA